MNSEYKVDSPSQAALFAGWEAVEFCFDFDGILLVCLIESSCKIAAIQIVAAATSPHKEEMRRSLQTRKTINRMEKLYNSARSVMSSSDF